MNFISVCGRIDPKSFFIWKSGVSGQWVEEIGTFVVFEKESKGSSRKVFQRGFGWPWQRWNLGLVVVQREAGCEWEGGVSWYESGGLRTFLVRVCAEVLGIGSL